MKNKNNRGFTLVELLAVVVILLAISVAAISSISAAIERNKVKQNNAKIAVIESYAKLYYDEHKNELINRSPKRISLDELDLEISEVSDVDGAQICGYVSYDPNNYTFNFVVDNTKCRDNSE